MPTWIVSGVAGAVALVASILASRVSVAAWPSTWPYHNDLTMLGWSLPLAIGVAVLTQWFRGGHSKHPLIMGPISGVALVLGWLLAANVMTAGIIFALPVLTCWPSGAMAGLLLGAFLPIRTRAARTGSQPHHAA
jgi:hypothetical protein